MESETIFIIAPLLVPFLSFIGILNLRAVCRATHLALRDINLKISNDKMWHLIYKTLNHKINYRHLRIKERIAELTRYYHPRIVGYGLITLSWDITEIFNVRWMRKIVKICGVNNTHPPTEDALNYLARIHDAMPDQAFVLMLESRIGLPKEAFWEVLRACKRPRSIDLLRIGYRIGFEMSGFNPDYFADRENMDLLWNRFRFENRFTGNMPGLHFAIQTELQQRLVANSVLEYQSTPHFLAVATPYILAYLYATPAQAIFLYSIADYIGTYADFALKTCGPCIMSGRALPVGASPDGAAPTLVEQVCAIAERYGVDGVEIYEYVMHKLESI